MTVVHEFGRSGVMVGVPPLRDETAQGWGTRGRGEGRGRTADFFTRHPKLKGMSAFRPDDGMIEGPQIL